MDMPPEIDAPAMAITGIGDLLDIAVESRPIETIDSKSSRQLP
jgi:hypothetical protein